MEELIKSYMTFDIYVLFQVAIRELKDELISLNKSQLKEGKRADGTDLPPYTPKYAKRKRKPLRPKTLYDTGDFYKGFDINFFKEYYEAFSRDYKDAFLPGKWGEEIYGLTDKSKEEVNKMLAEKLSNLIIQRQTTKSIS